MSGHFWYDYLIMIFVIQFLEAGQDFLGGFVHEEGELRGLSLKPIKS